MRAIVEITEDGVEIYSRTGKSQKGKCPHLETSLAKFPVGTVLDGEIALVADTTVVGQHKVPVVDFNKTMRIMGSGADKAVLRQGEFGEVAFLLFDVIQYGPTDLRERPQHARFDIADRLDAPGLMHNPRYHSNFSVIYSRLIEAGIEGAILKNTSTPYLEGKRSKDWLKVKSAKTFDVVISGFTDGQGKYAGQIGAIEFGAYFDDGSFAYVGRCSGMTDEERRHYTEVRDGKTVNTPIVIEVKANEMVGSGEYRTPRHPQYVCVRDDKNPDDCLMEQFKA
jgi:bifunctional non-homologous end joining protein LigD